jgi:hypothetical protein
MSYPYSKLPGLLVIPSEWQSAQAPAGAAPHAAAPVAPEDEAQAFFNAYAQAGTAWLNTWSASVAKVLQAMQAQAPQAGLQPSTPAQTQLAQAAQKALQAAQVNGLRPPNAPAKLARPSNGAKATSPSQSAPAASSAKPNGAPRVPARQTPNPDAPNPFMGSPLGTGLGFGGLFNAMKFSPDGKVRANAALQELDAPPADHPTMKYSAKVRADLARAGLPIDASGVRVMIVGEDAYSSDEHTSSHGPKVARSLAGPIGLAQGADVHLDQAAQPSPEVLAEWEEQARFSDRLDRGQVSLDDIAKDGAATLPQTVLEARDQLRATREQLPKDGKTTIVSRSQNGDIVSRVDRVFPQVDSAPAGSPLRKDMDRLLGHPYGEGGKADKVKVGMHLLERIHQEASRPAVQEALQAARTSLEGELEKDKQAGMIVFNGAGNSTHEGMPVEYGRSTIAGVKGLIQVGAAALGPHGDPSKATMAGFSSEGATIATVGAGMPIKAGPDGRTPVDDEGTSFAAPYAAGIAALMVKANPKITPDQITSIMTDARATHDLPGVRDGAGLVDPVRAVQMARDLALK